MGGSLATMYTQQQKPTSIWGGIRIDDAVQSTVQVLWFLFYAVGVLMENNSMLWRVSRGSE